jgi:histidine phosphotransfer protein HptB
MAETFDIEPLNRLVEDLGPAAAQRVVDMFVKMAPEYLKALDQHFKSKDAEGFKRAAHSLKSSARAVGGTNVAAYALHMEQGGLESYDMIDSLLNEIHKLDTILRTWRS